MLQRIQFADDDEGTGAYTLQYNPTELPWPDDEIINNIEMIDSESASQRQYWDGRQYNMVWRNYSINNSTFTSQISTLRSYKGSKKYINLRDINNLVVSDSSTWKGPFRIIDVFPKIKDGSGNTWESVTLVMVKAGA